MDERLLSLLQGASNSAAGAVTAPVDAIAWALRKAGVPIPSAPVGGSDWMASKGLLAQPSNYKAGLLGEALGGIAPMLVAAKAPQIAGGLLRAGENMAAQSDMARQGQRGMALFTQGTPGDVIKSRAEELAAAMRSKGWEPEVMHSGSAAGPSSYVNAYDPTTGRTLRDLRLSDHSKGAFNSQFIRNINTDDFPEVLSQLDDLRALGPSEGIKAIRVREAEQAAKVAARAQERLARALAKQAAGEPLSKAELNALKIR